MNQPSPFCTYSTKLLELMARDLELRLIRGGVSDEEIDTYIYAQLELADRGEKDLALAF